MDPGRSALEGLRGAQKVQTIRSGDLGYGEVVPHQLVPPGDVEQDVPAHQPVHQVGPRLQARGVPREGQVGRRRVLAHVVVALEGVAQLLPRGVGRATGGLEQPMELVGEDGDVLDAVVQA